MSAHKLWVHNEGDKPCDCEGDSCSISHGLSDAEIDTALSKVGRIDHAARHLIDVGIITSNRGSRAAREAFKDIARDILKNPTKTFDHVMSRGGQRVTGYYGKVDGKDVIIYLGKL